MKPRRLHRAPRAVLLWTLASFGGLQIGAAVAIETWLPQWRDPLYAYKASKLRRCMHSAAVPPWTVVMVGSSRTANGLRGNQLDAPLSRQLNHPVAVFNFGVGGFGPVRELLVVKRLLAEGLRPDLLLIEVMPPYLATQPTAPSPLRYVHPNQLWLAELPLVARYGWALNAIRKGWFQSWPMPGFWHRYDILNSLAPTWMPLWLRQDWSKVWDDSGWERMRMESQCPALRHRAAALTQEEYAPYLDHFRLGGPACQALDDLLALCRSKRLPTMLVLMPEGSDFRSSYSPAAWEQVRAFVDRLRKEFGVPLIDARLWIADEDFIDGHHLLTRGADAFTRRLGLAILAAVNGGSLDLPTSSRQIAQRRAEVKP